jgi:hypothetical protein
MQRRLRPNAPPSEIVCAIEVAGLRDVRGTTELIDFALTVANDPNFQGVLHWGQRHTADRTITERLFGDTVSNPVRNLGRWRQALSRVTENGRFDGFSSAFSRRAGLEVVTPIIWSFSANATRSGRPIDITWDCVRNPSTTQITVSVLSPAGVRQSQTALPLTGNWSVPASEAGNWRVDLVLELGSGALRRTATESRFPFVV